MPWQTQSLRSGTWRARILRGWRWACALSAANQRPAQLRPWETAGRAGPRCARGDQSAPRYRKFQHGNAIFVKAWAPNKSMDAGEFTTYMPSEWPALKKARKGETPASSDP